MFGDDPDPTDMTVRVGFRRWFRTRVRGLCTVQRNKVIACKGVVGLRTVKGGKGNAATTNGCEFYENMRMQCT